MPLVLRSVKGSPLTSAEVDGNFTYEDGRITALEALDIGNGIATVELIGNTTLRFTFDDSSIQDVELVPAKWTPQGEWQPSTPYVVNDTVTVAGRLYLVLLNHTSDTTFDPGENTDGNNFYGLLIDRLSAHSQNTNDSTFTPTLNDANTYNRCFVGCTVGVPANDDVNFPVDTEIHFREGDGTGAGPVTFEWPTAVIVNVPDGFEPSTNGAGSVVTLKKVGTDEWDLFGRLLPT